MQITDYEAPARPIDDTPDPRASQRVAAQKRTWHEDPEPLAHPRQLAPIALIAAALFLIGALTYGLSRPHVPLRLAPTEAPAQTFKTDRQTSPAPTSAPIAPTAVILPTAAPEPAQIGRGLTIEMVVATPEPPTAPEPSYIDQVGAQASHCVRTCDGQPGTSGGDWAAVPTAEPAMLEVIGRQVPHKVR
jgi:hypothetical protein